MNYRQDLQNSLCFILKQIKKTRRSLGRVNKDYNNHYCRTLGLTPGCHTDHVEDIGEYYKLAKLCSSVEEWERKFKAGIYYKSEESYYYNLYGEESLFLLSELEVKKNDLEDKLRDLKNTRKKIVSIMNPDYN